MNLHFVANCAIMDSIENNANCISTMEEAILKLYAEAHRLVIADLQREIADLQREVAKDGETSSERFLKDQIANCVKILRDKIKNYQDQYEVVMREQNSALATRFLDNVRRTQARNPEFAFLFSDKK